jgi:tRNA-dihydrouridine synthase A
MTLDTLNIETLNVARRLSVAPMMDWTDRRCRFLHRLLSRGALLYTEMVTAPAIVHGDLDRLLGHDVAEHPLALQLGGSDPAQLAAAVKASLDFGFSEINLNVGCPSDRVQSGAFGACLMNAPDLVARCTAAMIEAAAGRVEITVKCRIGVDKQVPEEVLPDFIDRVAASGVNHFAIHARMAWLDGLSPKQNRDIPPLNYPLALATKQQRPDLNIAVNGGVHSLEQAKAFLSDGFDGVMIGRAAYHEPAAILLNADHEIYGDAPRDRMAEDVVREMLPYIEARMAAGDRLNQITRHMLPLFQGRPGAKRWRRFLSENAHLPGAGPETVETALSALSPSAHAA